MSLYLIAQAFRSVLNKHISMSYCHSMSTFVDISSGIFLTITMLLLTCLSVYFMCFTMWISCLLCYNQYMNYYLNWYGVTNCNHHAEPPGVLIDSARTLVASKIPEDSVDDRREALLRASNLALTRGVTMILDMGRYYRGFSTELSWDDFSGLI